MPPLAFSSQRFLIGSCSSQPGNPSIPEKLLEIKFGIFRWGAIQLFLTDN
jgi:hypothetical protein